MQAINPAIRRFVAYVAVLAQLGLASCQDDSTYHGRNAPGGLVGGVLASYDIGEKVFVVVRAKLAASPVRAAEKVAALDARRAEFIAAVNAVVTPQAFGALGAAIDAVFRLVDDGTLPRMAENVAEILDALRREPGERTLRAIVALSTSARSPVQVDDALDFAGRVVSYREIEATFEAVAELIRGNDGVDDQGHPNGEPDLVRQVLAFASRLLRQAAQAPVPAAPAGLLDGLVDELLVDAPPGGGVSFGPSSWAVRADANGNPLVRRDPATGTLFAPFVDADGDGAADVNPDGDPVDATGATIAIPPFAAPGAPGYDAEGRALAATGALLYEYFDAKETLLSHFLQLGGEGLRRGIHTLGYDVAEIALGARVFHDGGTPADPSDDFAGFAADNPVTDLGWGALEVAKYEGTPRLLRAVAEVVRTEPLLAERIILELGKVLEKLRPIATAQANVPPTAQSRALADRACELVDRVFDRGARPSTGRLLLEALHDLGLVARNLPRQLALMMEHSSLALDAAGNPDPARSVLVDRSRPPTRAGSPQGENRSVLHQLLDLLAEADRCPTYFGLFGAPLSETIIDVMAGRSAQFVGTLIDFVDNPLVQGYLAISCPAIRDDLQGLKGLSASGALEGFLPVAKVFVDRGETRLLVDILATLDASYADLLWPYEPVMTDILKSGAVEIVFDLLDLLVAGSGGRPIVDPVSGARAIDLVADAIGNLMDHPAGGVPDRYGRPQPTLAHLVIEPLRRIEDRIFAASGGAALATSLVYTVTDLAIERVTNDNGTPGDPADDFEQLRNPSFAPFVGRLCVLLARNLPASAAERAARISVLQADLAAFLTSRDFAAAADLARTLRGAAGAGAICDATANLLTPNAVASDDVFGSLLKVLAGALETRVDTAPLRDIAAFLADLLDPGGQRVAALVVGVSRLLQADRGKVFIQVVRNLLNEPPAAAGLPAGSSPAEVLLSVAGDVRRAGATSAGDRLTELIAAIDSAVAFIRDPQGVLQEIFRIIRNRPK